MKDVRFNFYRRLDKYIDDPLHYESLELGFSSVRIKFKIKTLYDLYNSGNCTYQLTTLQL